MRLFGVNLHKKISVLFKRLVKRILFSIISNLVSSNLLISLMKVFLTSLPPEDFLRLKEPLQIKWLGHLANLKTESNSQLSQDLWVTFRTKNKRAGYFVDIGACHPTNLSNSYLLEKSYEWNGILVEPNPSMSKLLKIQRTARIVEVAVAPGTEIQLRIASIPEFTATRGQLEEESHPMYEFSGEILTVKASTLTQILRDNNAPKYIDFLSLDIEGGEEFALQSLDFNEFRPFLISVEHNFGPARSRIKAHLEFHGYILDPLCSMASWDDWFIDPLSPQYL